MPCGCNPTKPKICEICSKKVSKKKGIQCEGVCQRWIHYKCLNLCSCLEQDVKKGLVKIRCPCTVCADDTTLDDPEPLSTPPCCFTPLPPKLSSKSSSALSQSRRVNDLDGYGNDRLGSSQTRDKCQTCSPKVVEVTPNPGKCSGSSIESAPRRSKAPCPTPNDCDAKSLCRTVSEITDEIETLMRKLKTLLEHQEMRLNQKCYSYNRY